MPRKLYCETIALPAGAKPWPRMQMSQYHSSRFFTRMMVDVSRAAVSQSAPRRAFMKYAIVAVLWGVAVVAAAQTSKKDGAAAAEPAEQALKSVENEWVEALAKADTARLDSILAETYVDTDEQSHRSNKKGVLSALQSGDLKIESIKLSDMKVDVYGDAAVVTGNAAQKGSFKGLALPANVIFTDTFIKREGKWRAVES